MFSFGLWVDALTKAVGHKYIKRIPYQSKGKRRYRYIYKVTHSHQGRHAFDEAHLQEGTAFSLSTKAGEEFHGHVTKIEGDQVSYRIDDGPEKGTVKTTSKRELLAKLNDVHDIESQLTSERDKLRNQIKEARKNKASEKQIARLESRLSRLGGKQEGEPPKTPRGHLSPSEMEEIERYEFALLAEGKPEARNGYLREQDLSTIEAKLNDWKEYYDNLKESEPDAYRKRKRFRQWRQFEQLKRYVRTRRAEGRLKGEGPPKAPAPEPIKQVKEQTPEEREAGRKMFEQLFGHSIEGEKQGGTDTTKPPQEAQQKQSAPVTTEGRLDLKQLKPAQIAKYIERQRHTELALASQNPEYLSSLSLTTGKLKETRESAEFVSDDQLEERQGFKRVDLGDLASREVSEALGREGMNTVAGAFSGDEPFKAWSEQIKQRIKKTRAKEDRQALKQLTTAKKGSKLVYQGVPYEVTATKKLANGRRVYHVRLVDSDEAFVPPDAPASASLSVQGDQLSYDETPPTQRGIVYYGQADDDEDGSIEADNIYSTIEDHVRKWREGISRGAIKPYKIPDQFN